MKRGMLSDYFSGVGVKKLVAVDTLHTTSTQHEINGSKVLTKILGTVERKRPPGQPDERFRGTYMWIGAEQEAITEEGRLSWYDSRKKKTHRHAEWRLYYQGNPVTELMREDDTLFVAKRNDDHLFFVVVPQGSTIESQLIWLFGIDDSPELSFEQKEIGTDTDAVLDFAARYILDELGIEPEEPEADLLDRLIKPFGLKFPKTAVISKLARDSLPAIDPIADPDAAVVAWMDREEQLFRRLERHVIADRIVKGFAAGGEIDVDGFLDFSKSVRGRRMSRAGSALENHLEAIFQLHGVRYVRGKETENRNKPDFLFPGQTEYRDATFPDGHLTMLGSKSTLKDRWRQVTREAKRIPAKHLLTLEPGISEHQTDQMIGEGIQLVIPRPLHTTFKPAQQAWLMDLRSFLDLVLKRQAA